MSNRKSAGSKKRDRNYLNHDEDSNSKQRDERHEQVQADHELFLQAFEKPTQIYRFLRTRNRINPVFLYRNLTFMKNRSTRTNAGRKKFKVDSLLDRLEQKIKDSGSQEGLPLGGYMTITFLGYYDSKKSAKMLDGTISAELLLLKTGHKKRKETPFLMESAGSVEIPCNPSEDHPPNKAPALSVSCESLTTSNGHQAKLQSLLLKVHRSDSEQPVQSQNGQIDENTEPSSKRRKTSLNMAGESSEETSSTHSGMSSGQNGVVTSFPVLSSELRVFDKNIKSHLADGEYEVILKEKDVKEFKCSPKKNSTWETKQHVNGDPEGALDVFDNFPSVKFRLSWTREPAGPLVERPRPLMTRGLNHQQTNAPQQLNHSTSDVNSKREKKTKNHSKSQNQNPPRIVYQFLFNNNTRQQTEAREDLRCPWCTLNCMELYPLLKHLKLSHPRFLFTYVPMSDGARIDVTVSELYDSTYVGNPHDLINQPPGAAFSRCGPVQRTSITNVLVSKPKRTPPSLSEFLEIEENDLNGPYDGQRPFVTGHNRLYHYSTTCLPMPPHAILHESTEDLVDPQWLTTKMCQMIDEFSDVNEGEKEFMKMWNVHVQHYTFVGDCQIPLAIKMFIEENGKELIAKGLYKNYLLHVSNLFEFGVLAPGGVFTAITQLQQFMLENGLSSQLNWKSQHVKWKESKLLTATDVRKDFTGIFKSGTSPVVTVKDEKDE